MPDPEVVRVMRQFKRDLLRQESAQMREMSRRWVAVERRLNGNIHALAEKMARIRAEGGTVPRELILQDQHYRTLYPQLINELDRYTDYANGEITEQQRRLMRLGIAHAQNAIEATGVRAGFSRLPVEAVESMVGLAGDGSPLRALLANTWLDAVDGLTQELINGVAIGLNPRTLARNMARGSTRSLDRMMVIARTEQLRVYRHANRESYRSSGVVSGYRRLATHDSRVCPACLMAEGQFYSFDEDMATHPQCRCTMIPVVEGMPAVTWQAGADWFVEQSPSVQRSILGPGRYDAWLGGAFDLAELVRVRPNVTWGDTLQTATLQQLTGA